MLLVSLASAECQQGVGFNGLFLLVKLTGWVYLFSRKGGLSPCLVYAFIILLIVASKVQLPFGLDTAECTAKYPQQQQKQQQQREQQKQPQRQKPQEEQQDQHSNYTIPKANIIGENKQTTSNNNKQTYKQTRFLLAEGKVKQQQHQQQQKREEKELLTTPQLFTGEKLHFCTDSLQQLVRRVSRKAHITGNSFQTLMQYDPQQSIYYVQSEYCFARVHFPIRFVLCSRMSRTRNYVSFVRSEQ